MDLKRRSISTFFTLIIIGQTILLSQSATAVPFLLKGTSLSGNALGEMRASTNSGSAIMGTFNPGLLGVQSFTKHFNSEFYLRRTPWFPNDPLDLYFYSRAITFGAPLFDSVGTPLPISFGIGYSQMYFNLGEFKFVSDMDPTNILKGNGYERVDVVSIGSAVSYGATIGFGVNIKRIISSFPIAVSRNIINMATASPLAIDIGTFIDIPIIGSNIEDHIPDQSISFIPQLSFNIAYVYSNIGGNVDYGDPNQADPLPRTITVGYGINGGILMNIFGSSINLISAKFIREADDIAVQRTRSDWTYQYGFGDIPLYEGLILGKYSNNATIKKGFAIQFLDLVTIRSGSNKMPYRDYIITEGIEVHITGILKFLHPLTPTLFDFDFMSYLFEHVEIRYLQSSYSGISLLSGSSFEGFTFAIK